jgi:pre-mRNA-splicing helicase BRR2
LKTEEGTDA